MKKLLLISALFVLLFPVAASAVCPVCTVAVGAGLGLAEYLGIDDAISGLWIGALTVSLAIWTINWLNKKLGFEEFRSRHLRERKEKAELWKRIAAYTIITLLYYLLIVGPLWWRGFIGSPLNKFCGVDKLLLGIFIGSIFFLAGVLTHNYLRKRNGGKSYFKGQKIVAAVLPTVIASIIFYFIC